MAMTAAGTPALAIDNLRNTLADCAEFRTMVGASGASVQVQARARVHHFALPRPVDARLSLTDAESLRPFGLIYPADGGAAALAHAASGIGFDYTPAGTLMLELEQDVPANIAADLAEVEWQWMIRIGKIMDELAALAGGGGYLAIEKLEVADGPWRSPEVDRETKGDWQGVTLSVEWS